MFNGALIDELRRQVAKLEAENTALKSEVRKLTERLLLRVGTPLLHEPLPTPDKIEKLLNSNDIFGEDEIDGDDNEIIDNRKERDEQPAY